MDKVIKKSVLSFPVMFEKVEDIQVNDERFIKVKVFLMHLGLNYNQSIFDKEAVEAAIPTLEYIPIVGFIERNGATDENDFAGHQYIIVKDENGVRRKYIGHAYGVIKSSADNNAHFEMRMCDDGVEREFLVVDGLMWSMFEDSAEIMNRDLIKGHSMELFDKGIEGYEDEDGNFHFEKFSFRAACVLGDTKEPAMQNSTVEVQFTMKDFARDFMVEIQNELDDKYNLFLNYEKDKKEGGNETMPNENKDFTMSVMQQFENIAAIVKEHETFRDRWGDSIARYQLVDIQDNQAIVIDRADNYRYYGFTFTVNGDDVTIDFTSGVRKKIVYEDYNEADETPAPEGAFDFGTEVTAIVDKAFEQIEKANENASTMETNYNAVKHDYDEMKPKFDEYVRADEQRKIDEMNDKKDLEFARFEKMLKDNDEFVALKEKRDELSLDEITSQCSILFTRLSLENKIDFTKNKNDAGTLSVGVLDDEPNDNFVQTKYGNIPVNR